MTAWNVAQSKEIHHAVTANISRRNYELILLKYFGLTESHFVGKTIMEVGGGNFPLCNNIPACRRAVNIEPLWDFYESKCKPKDFLQISAAPFEQYQPAEVLDEIWFFNFLQHPESTPLAMLQKARRCARLLRVFEPINTLTDEMHLHTLTADTFREAFPTAAMNRYGMELIPGFFGGDCIYFEATT